MMDRGRDSITINLHFCFCADASLDKQTLVTLMLKFLDLNSYYYTIYSQLAYCSTDTNVNKLTRVA